MLRATFALVILNFGTAFAAIQDCGDPFENGVGPWDYRSSEAQNDPHQIPVVERYHFAPKVERLIEGQSQHDLAGDLDYVLRAVPNHHRALYAITRYERLKGSIDDQWYSAECYFERALTFRPDDSVVQMLFGVHWAMRSEHKKAVQYYEFAMSDMPDSAELKYNLGLSLVALGEFARARDIAKSAYQDGYPLDGLRLKLEQKGYGWEN